MDVNYIWREESTPEADRFPFVGVALHDGHYLRDDVAELMILPEADRLREEDPFTSEWTSIAPTRIVALASRFQVDLNRPRATAVYRTPEDAWGLSMWRDQLPQEVIDRSLQQYDDFYEAMERILRGAAERYGRFVVFDLHSYGHRRDGPDGPHADVDGNPQVNVGTGTMDRARWAPVVDRFINDLRAYPFPTGTLDVRENVKFIGRRFPEWTHQTFPESACVLALEFKKFFMDEWTGEPDRHLIEEIKKALDSTLPGLQEELERA